MAKSNEKPKTDTEQMPSLYRRLFEAQRALVGLSKSRAQGVHGEFWSADRVCLHVRNAMNEQGVIHNFDIQTTDIQRIDVPADNGKTDSKLLISIIIMFTYINVDDPEQREIETLAFKDIQSVKQLNLNAIISKARKTHYVGKFNIAVDEDSETPFQTQNKTSTTQTTQQTSARQNFGPEWVFSFGDFKGTKLKDIPTHALLGYLDSKNIYPNLKVAIRYFLKSQGIATDFQNEVHK